MAGEPFFARTDIPAGRSGELPEWWTKRSYITPELNHKIAAALLECSEMRRQLDHYHVQHNGEVCVDVQEYCDKLKAENVELRTRLAVLLEKN